MKNLDESIVRILEIRLKNYKNISDGQIKPGDISSLKNGMADICGIYGQNGTGKTSVISAVSILKKLFMDMSLPDDMSQIIMQGEKETEIEILFYMKNADREYKVEYLVVIELDKGKSSIKEESIRYWSSDDGENWGVVRGLIVNKNTEKSISPLYRDKEIAELYDERIGFHVYRRMQFAQNKSMFFSSEFRDLIDENLDTLGEEYEIIGLLYQFAYFNLFIVDSRTLALSDANILLPINIKSYRGNTMVLPIGLDKPVYLPKELVSDIESSLLSSNLVLSEIIPGLTIEAKELSIRTSEDGEEEILIELLSNREGIKIPIRYESDGIKKIVTVIHLLIAMYNYNFITVLIDEFDSGIFEYLLGELLEVLEKRAKGQLIFTSHNFRPLEVMDKNNLVFTTTNPNNRFIKLRNVKTNNNLRDLYYRDLVLGGQKEEIYQKTNSAKITRAFRKAGI